MDGLYQEPTKSPINKKNTPSNPDNLKSFCDTLHQNSINSKNNSKNNNLD